MRQAKTYTSWLITCHSPEESRTLQYRLSSCIKLKRVLTDTVCTLPNGLENVESVPHRLGNYFADIRLLPVCPETLSSFRLVFHRLPQAGRFWKDLMVRILQEIEAAPETASITLDYKGDEEPQASPANFR